MHNSTLKPEVSSRKRRSLLPGHLEELYSSGSRNLLTRNRRRLLLKGVSTTLNSPEAPGTLPIRLNTWGENFSFNSDSLFVFASRVSSFSWGATEKVNGFFL